MRSQAERLDFAILLSTLASIRGGLETTAVTLARGLATRGHRITLIAGGSPLMKLPPDLSQVPARWLLVPYVSARAAAWHLVPSPGLPFRVQSASFNTSCSVDPRVRNVLRRASVTMTLLPRETAHFSRIRRARGLPHISYFPGGGTRWVQADQSTIRLVNPAVAMREPEAMSAFPPDGIFNPGFPDRWLNEEYHVRSIPRTLLFVGRLEPNKGVVELLELFRSLVASMPDVKLRIVGEGPLRGSMVRTARESALNGRVTFVGAVSQEAVHAEMKAADLLLFPTHFENLPLTLLEASATGLPFIASDITGIRGLVSPDSTLVPLGNNDAWVIAVLTMKDAAKRRLASESGRRWAASYSWDRVVEEMEGHLFKAVERCR